jgi:heat shock protein HslJ
METSARHHAPVEMSYAASQTPLDRDWMIVWIRDYAGDPRSLIPLPGFIMTTAAARVTGETSCNRFTSGYRIDPATRYLQFTGLRNTRRFCQRDNAAADDAIIRELLATDSYALDDGHLELLSRGNPVMRLRQK